MRLKATMRVLDDRRYICGECLKKFDGRADGEKLLETQRRLNGCYGDNRAEPYIYDDISFLTCPGNVFDSDSIWLIELWREYQKGVLPFEGCLTQQPAKIIEAFSIIDIYNAKKIKDAEMDAQRKQRVSSGNRRRHNPKI